MEATVSEQNPVATMLQYCRPANMSRMAPQLLGLTGALYLDLTRDGLHTLAPQTRELLERRRGNLQAELAITSRASLNLGLKDAAQRIQDLLERGSIPSYTRRPEYLTAREQQLLQGRGLQPFAIQQVVSDTLVSRQVWSALQLRQGEHTAGAAMAQVHWGMPVSYTHLTLPTSDLV